MVGDAGPVIAKPSRADLTGKTRDLAGLLFQLILLGSLLLSLLFLLTLMYQMVVEAIPVFRERGGEFLTGRLSVVTGSTAGIGQGILGSVLTLIFVVLVAFPLGIGSAIYLEEYARDTRLNRFININVRNLAGVPSIVFGLLGLTIFVKLMAPITGGKSVIAAGLTLAALVLPIVIITTAEALRAVPKSIREAGFGVGATRWQVIRHHVLPPAAPGVLTGTVLSLSRALGETAPVLLVGAVTGYLATGSTSLYEQLYSSFTTLPTIIFRWSSLPSSDFRSLTSAAIVVLLAMTLLANTTAILLRNRFERKW